MLDHLNLILQTLHMVLTDPHLEELLLDKTSLDLILVPPNHSGVQTGGAFNQIVNPKTGRKVNVNGKLGKQILQNYINELYN